MGRRNTPRWPILKARSSTTCWFTATTEHFLLVVNAGNIDKDFDWIASHNKFDAAVENVSDQTSLLAFKGQRRSRSCVR